MDVVEKVADDIRALRIQGARNVARAALNAIRELVLSMRGKSGKDIMEAVRRAAEILARSRPTEPAMRDALTYALRAIKEVNGDVDEFLKRLEDYERNMEEARQRIAEFGARKIPDGGTVITHCHSSELMSVFARAAREKTFTVIVTETRPRYQGKITARELLDLGVRVVYVVDAAAYTFMREADVYMTGADAITSDGYVANKVGTALIALAARYFHVPYYVVASTLKFDPVTLAGFPEPIEERDPSEVIDPSELPGAEIRNPAFDIVPPDLVTGIVTELGVFSPQSLAAVLMQRGVDAKMEEVIALFRLLEKRKA